MNDKIKKLRRERKSIIESMRELVNKVEQEGRDFNEEEKKQYESYQEKVKSLQAQEERELEILSLEQELETVAPEDQTAVEKDTRSGAIPPKESSKSKEKIEFAKQPAWRSFGEFLVAVKRSADPDVSDRDPMVQRLRNSQEEFRAISGMSESLPSEGGWLVQQEYVSELIQKTYDLGQFISRVRKIPIGAGKNGVKINSIYETSRATGSRWGGIQVYWIGEGEVLTASKPKFRQLSLDLKKVAGLLYVTDELLEDAVALEATVTQAFPLEFSFIIDDAIFRGTGVGQPFGFINSPALVTVSKEVGQAAGTIVAENILNMWSRCWGRSRQNAVWFINQDVEPQLSKLSLPIGTGGVPVYMPAGGISGQPYTTLFGRPVIPTEHCATLGTIGDIVLVDLGEYLFIDKGTINQASSMHVRFLYDEMCYRFVYRCDGQPVWNSPLTPYQGSNTLSPFVALESR